MAQIHLNKSRDVFITDIKLGCSSVVARGIKRFSEVFFALLRFRLKLQYIEIVFEQLQLLVLLQPKSINTIGTSKNQAIVLQCIFRQPCYI